MKNHPCKLLPLIAFAAISLPLSFVRSATIVDYTFDNTGTRPAPVTGSSISSISTTLASIGGYNSWATGSETGEDYIFFNGSSGAGRFIDISLDATGYSDITLGSFFQMSAQNALAADTWQLSYSLNGGTSFTQIGSDYSVILTGGGNSENSQITTGSNFALGTGADNNANIVFRFNSAPGASDFNSNTADGGQIKLDNFTITAIPEPSSFLLMGLFALAVLAFRRRS